MLKKKLRKNKLLRKRRKITIRHSLSGTPERPRVSVYKSLKHMYAQVIDDVNRNTLVSASTLQPEFEDKVKKDMSGKEKAELVGKILAEKCKDKKIKKVCFDRNGFKYHGRVKALANGAREGGLDF
ncbi:MAG: 50S ribosomal protein L18 [Candidatus Cloacimonetes bacterium]|nr:50S ribosomal protein L18 [Candidatus Cloacimonadota bacterium]MBS3766930.1 50S ribosomal protein L18 [Candidatus Cloacimonadota bacterium]